MMALFNWWHRWCRSRWEKKLKAAGFVPVGTAWVCREEVQGFATIVVVVDGTRCCIATYVPKLRSTLPEVLNLAAKGDIPLGFKSIYSFWPSSVQAIMERIDSTVKQVLGSR